KARGLFGLSCSAVGRLYHGVHGSRACAPARMDCVSFRPEAFAELALRADLTTGRSRARVVFVRPAEAFDRRSNWPRGVTSTRGRGHNMPRSVLCPTVTASARPNLPQPPRLTRRLPTHLLST